MSARSNYRSKIAIYDLATRSYRVVHEVDGVMEAPNWCPDGQSLLLNQNGGLYRLALGNASNGSRLLPFLEPARFWEVPDSGTRELLHIASRERLPNWCNNDHGISVDGRRMALSIEQRPTPSSEGSTSRVCVARSDGSRMRIVTPLAPSYFHGWSPDGAGLVFVGERGDGKYEIYRISADDGDEVRLTSAGGDDDGPEYAPNGNWIYFNSNRTGRWEIWRIPSSGGGTNDTLAQQVTHDEPENWFAHPSPDGKWLVFLAFPPGTLGHNCKMDGVMLRMMRLPDELLESSEVELLTTFYGGQGTINVNSWSPDSKQFAFVIYEPELPEVP